MKRGTRYQHKFFIGLIFILSPLFTQADHYVYLDDVDVNSSNARPMTDDGYPRVILSETKVFAGNMERYTKYGIISGQSGSKKKAATIQNLNPEVKYLWHFSPRAYQNYTSSHCQIGKGVAFESSGATTQGGPSSRGCSVYAGHWLYKAGTTLTQNINATTTSIKVANVSGFTVGQFLVIYNAPKGSFNGAEHAKITGKNTSTNTLTVASRGFKSNARSHNSGAIVAQHVTGQGGHPENWSFNMSSQSPRDGNNKTAAQAIVDWAAANINKDKRGSNVNVRVDGIQFDADFYDELESKKSDANNDGVTDHGVSPSGVNWWGEGFDNFYQLMRNRFPGKIIVSGNRKARGFDSINGTQIEAFPASNRTQPVPKYDDISGQFSRYTFHLHTNKSGPLHTHNLNKTPTRIYPEGHSNTGNSVFRLGLGLTLMDDGYYGHENSEAHPDPWYDEYAVNVTPGDSDYGRAVRSNTANESAVRDSLGWLGDPLGERKRIYNHTDFATGQALLNGSFDANINGWSGSLVNVSRDTSIKKDGSAALRVSTMTSFKSGYSQAKVKGPKINVVNGREYTMVFTVRSTSDREFAAAVGNEVNRFIVGKDWRRYVYTFKSKKTANELVWFGVGREKQQLWIDSVYIFEGNANVMRRDFENGTVVVNATPSNQTVNLGETFQRIQGTQDSVNNGSNVTNITIPAWDAAILVRPDGDRNNPNGVDPCGKPPYNVANEKALFIWKTCNGSGRWHIRGTAGGTGGSVLYEGNIQASTGAFSVVSEVDIESHDSVSTANANKRINLSMKMWDGFEDGISFTAGVNAEVCFNITPNNRIIVGQTRILGSGSVCLKE